MDGSIPRDEAIEQICKSELAGLSSDERAEQLDIMMVETWESDPRWPIVPLEVRRIFEEQEEIRDPLDSRFDSVLMIWLRSGYSSARNEYLLERIRALRPDVNQVKGTPVTLVACPCCGYRTLGSRGDYDICGICWWEDDGQDNEDADIVRGGPNYHISLTRARINFLTDGISDPARDDLRSWQEPAKKYVLERRFELERPGVVVEPESGWRGVLIDEEK